MSTSPRSGSVFVSYKREEAAVAASLREALIAEGFDVWWDENLQCGQAWAATLDEVVQEAACIVVLWSECAVASKWVRHEASQAIARNVYAPCRLELVQLDSPYDRIQATDLVGWNGDREHGGLRNLIDRVNQLVPPQIAWPRRFARWLWTNRVGVVASGVALLALLTLAVIIHRVSEITYRVERVRMQDIFDCGTALGLRASLAREWRSVGGHLMSACLSEANLERVDLNGAMLQNADLAGANLKGAILRGAMLDSADLTGAILAGADLTDAKLRGAILTDAHLGVARLHGADLTGASLHGAYLGYAILTESRLDRTILLDARLHKANLRMAKLPDVDLTGVDLSSLRPQYDEELSVACADHGPNNEPSHLPRCKRIRISDALDGNMKSGERLSREVEVLIRKWEYSEVEDDELAWFWELSESSRWQILEEYVTEDVDVAQ